MQDPQSAGLEDVDRAMLEYAAQLTRQPWTIDQARIGRLRRVGLDDRAIHDLCAIVAYFAFANRIANGLGIEVETD